MPWSPAVLPMTVPLYYSISTKAGDTLTNPTTETKFASKYTVPANSLAVGETLMVRARGLYSIPSAAVTPTANAKAYFGSTALVATGNLTVGLGTGIEFPFWGDLEAVVKTIGSTGTLQVAADFNFQITGGGAPTVAALGLNPSTITVDTTTASDVVLAVVASNQSSQYFKLTHFIVWKLQATPAST